MNNYYHCYVGYLTKYFNIFRTFNQTLALKEVNKLIQV